MKDQRMDMRPLRWIADVDGPFAAAYFDCSHDTEDAARQIELRWRGVRDQLEGQGARRPDLEAIDQAVAEAPPATGRAGHGLVAARGEVQIDQRLAKPPITPLGRASHRPYLLPLATLVPRSVPYVVVVADRKGAEIRVVSHGEQTHTVSGRKHPIHKIRGGGWAQHRIQNRVEQIVRQNMEHVARVLAHFVDDVNARLLVVAGEIQARAELAHDMTARCREIAMETEVGRRAVGWDKEALDYEVERLVAECAAKHVAAEIDARRGLKLETQGWVDTLEALRTANVEALLLSESTFHAERPVWAGPESHLVAARERDLKYLGFRDALRLRADEALPVAAIAVGADVLVTADQLADGVGALLRHR
jgi:peptide subunit release factor 1 (eRF1)